ncbi:MAG TPA: carboxypeptidase-like regulatory domain-containing protein, partial [Niabella sp.]|nr:carboxypeptidase-like regulatory domain-containing protein [Niabella sp.]
MGLKQSQRIAYHYAVTLRRTITGCLAKKYFLVFLLVIISSGLMAQTTVTGTVRNEKSEPLPGVSVTISGTTSITVTDLQGHYTIEARAGQAIVFSFVGYASKEIVVGDEKTIDVQLAVSAVDLGEVVVVGYGTQQRKDLTGAVSVVNASEVKKRQATTVAEAMQGLATGIKVRGGGRPGSEAQIQIRGLKNVSESNPLYVID